MILSDIHFCQYLNTVRIEAEKINRQLYTVPNTILDERPEHFEKYLSFLPDQLDKCTFNLKKRRNIEPIRDKVFGQSKKLISLVDNILLYRRNPTKAESKKLIGPALKSLSKFRLSLREKFPGVDF